MCTFSNNASDLLGGAVAVGFYENSTPVFTGCIFEGNTANTWAGGLSCYGARTTLTECIFTNNHAQHGGAIRVRDALSEIVVADCEFEGNTASGTGGGVDIAESSSASLGSCTFYGNSSNSGGAISCDTNAALTLKCSTLYGNDATSGSGLRFSTVSPCTIDNCIIAGGIGGAAIAGSGTPPTLTCTDIHGNEGGDWVGYIADQYGVNGNIGEDPLFCNAEYMHDLRLQEASPCAAQNNPECGQIGAWTIGCPYSDLEDELVGLPAVVQLRPASPNPFSRTTEISFEITGDAGASAVILNVMDPAGRLVQTWVQAPRLEGYHRITWNGTDHAGRAMTPGVYFCRLAVGGQSVTQRLLLIR
jgi:parallel beta-helix repeat protein